MGLFLAANGWSDNVPPLLKQNGVKRIRLVDGYDLRCVLDRRVGRQQLLGGKLSARNLDAEPFLSAAQVIGR